MYIWLLDRRMSMPDKPSLSEPHRRSLSVTAKHVERAVNELNDLLGHASKSFLCESITRSLTKDERQQYVSLVRELQRLNEQMFHTLQLETSTMDERQIISSKLVHLGTVLEDSRSKKMRRYGALTDERAQEIDRHIQRLLDVLEKAIRT